MKQGNSNQLQINDYFKFIWCDPYHFKNYVKQDLMLYEFFKNLLNNRFNDMSLKRSIFKTNILIYLNPSFDYLDSISKDSLKLLINNLFKNRINISFINVATFKLNKTDIKQVHIYDYTKLANLLASYIGYLLKIDNNILRIKEKISILIKKKEILGTNIIISGIFESSNMAQKKVIKIGKVNTNSLSSNIYYSLKKVHLPYGVYGVKVYINIKSK